ncbi:hypothetical protein QE152_g13220 [Popillia japonica]|uniref:Uncharacterized protein n=1 Tax=Popillia japonica TaxID=7064 RepID=A0AAW1LEW5_POPJA
MCPVYVVRTYKQKTDRCNILDNHESHVSLAAILYCRQNGIHLLSFSPSPFLTESKKRKPIITDIRPYPKASSSSWRRKREQGCSRIYTSTAEVGRIEEKARAHKTKRKVTSVTKELMKSNPEKKCNINGKRKSQKKNGRFAKYSPTISSESKIEILSSDSVMDIEDTQYYMSGERENEDISVETIS